MSEFDTLIFLIHFMVLNELIIEFKCWCEILLFIKKLSFEPNDHGIIRINIFNLLKLWEKLFGFFIVVSFLIKSYFIQYLPLLPVNRLILSVTLKNNVLEWLQRVCKLLCYWFWAVFLRNDRDWEKIIVKKFLFEFNNLILNLLKSNFLIKALHSSIFHYFMKYLKLINEKSWAPIFILYIQVRQWSIDSRS
jgi:hypothetical protein